MPIEVGVVAWYGQPYTGDIIGDTTRRDHVTVQASGPTHQRHARRSRISDTTHAPVLTKMFTI